MCDGIKELKKYESHWHLDKRVPIAMIGTLAGQFILAVVVGTIMWAQVQQNTSDIKSINRVMPQVYKMVENTEHMKEDIREMNENIKELTRQLYGNRNGD